MSGSAPANLELEEQLGRRRALYDRLAGGAPELASALAEAPADSVWDERAGDFDRAWNWSRAQAWVICMAAPDSERQHRLELENAKQTAARVRGVDPTNVVYRREAGATPPMPPCGWRAL